MLKRLLYTAFTLLVGVSAAADVAPARSLRNGKIYFIYDAHADDGSSTPHDKDTNYRYAFRYTTDDNKIMGNHVKAATAIAEARTFAAAYAWRAVENNGNWQFQNIASGLYVSADVYASSSPATMVLEPTESPTQFTLRLLGTANNRWDGDYNRTGAFWNYQYSYPFVWWEGEGHPYEFYEATLTAADTYAFADLDRTKIALVAQRALELKNSGMVSAAAYASAAEAIARANSNDEALEAFNDLLATIASCHFKVSESAAFPATALTLSADRRLFVEYTNTYLPGTYLFSAAMNNVADGTLRLNNTDVSVQAVSAADAAADHLAGALALAADWPYSSEPGHVSISAEAYAARQEAEAAQGKNLATMRSAADALFAADASTRVNLPTPGNSYAINYQYTFGLTYNNFLATDNTLGVTTARTPQAWALSESNGNLYLAAKGLYLCADQRWTLAAQGSPLQIAPAEAPDANGIYPFEISCAEGALAFEFHIMYTNVVLDTTTPMAVYLTNAEPDQSSIHEIVAEPASALYDLQGRRVHHPAHGIYIRQGQKIRL